MKKTAQRKPANRIKWRLALIVLAVVASAALFNFASASGLTSVPLQVLVQGWVNVLSNPQLTAERHIAQEHLEEAGEASVDPLMKALQSENVNLRRNSAEMLGYLASPRAAETLGRALKQDRDPVVRENAAWALGEIKALAYLKDLEQTAVLDPSSPVRASAVEAIQTIRLHLAHAANLNEADVSAMAVAPSYSNLVYLASRRDLYVSGDGGKTWQVLRDAVPGQVLTLAVDPKSPHVLYVGVDGLGLYRSDDGGLTWEARNTGLEVQPGARVGVTAITIDESDSQRILVSEGLWIGTKSVQFFPRGIYQSRDGGVTWQLRAQSTNTRAISRIILKGDELYALAGNDVVMMAVY